MFLRIAGIVLPIFIIVLVGYLYGRKHKPEMIAANRMNMEVFLPALIFSALAGKNFDLAQQVPLAIGAAVVVLGSGLLAWPLAHVLRVSPKTLVPPVMFNNSGNMGLPLTVLAFGEQALGAALVLMLVETLLQFALHPWLMNRQMRLGGLLREPVFMAAALGILVSLSGFTIAQPIMTATRILGDISIGLMIFSLGVRLSSAAIGAWRVGIVGAILTPLTGIAIAWVYGPVGGLTPIEQDILVVFGALPPAVVNFIFAERFNQEPDKVASIVMVGNAFALLFVSLALALRF